MGLLHRSPVHVCVLAGHLYATWLPHIHRCRLFFAAYRGHIIGLSIPKNVFTKQNIYLNACRLAPIRRGCAGDHFGEKALVEKTPRTATVKAHGPLKCAALSIAGFERLMASTLNEKIESKFDRHSLLPFAVFA